MAAVTPEDMRSWTRPPSPGETTAAIVVALRLRSAAQPRRRKRREGGGEEEEAVGAELVGEQRGLDRGRVWSGEEEGSKKGWAPRLSISRAHSRRRQRGGWLRDEGGENCLFSMEV